jgi:predicted PurR-regulated permease PerM
MRQIRNIVIILVGIAAGLMIVDKLWSMVTVVGDVLVIFGFAWLLNLLLEPLVEGVFARLPRAYGWGIGYTSVLLLIVGLTAPIAAQATTLPDLLPSAIQSATLQTDSLLFWLRDHRITVPVALTRPIEDGSLAQEAGRYVLDLTLSLLNIGGQFLLVIGAAAAMAAGDATLGNLMIAILPDSWLSRVARIYDDIRRTYSAAVRGQLAIWAIGMVLSFGTMAFFATPGMWLWIGPIALVRLLPYFGGLLGGALTVVVMLLSLPWPGSLVPVLFFIVAQNIVGYLVEPLVLSRALQLSPALVLFAVLIGWKIGGVTGIVFCVPAVAVVQTLIEHRVRSRAFQTMPPEAAPPRVPEPPLIVPPASPALHDQPKPRA